MGKKNPVIVKARQEGYNDGFKIGFEQGVETGRINATYILASRFDGLNKVPGIGPKMLQKIVNHFGKEYFQEVPDEFKKFKTTSSE
ncbi:hypothetical protein [Metabacillus bambusae]|uniref:Uncharacterized protein n=1 Tax=Metabacillus bambusae TaxID=2795218 RepID=A0ABS3NBI7_9BACI|nr:hypothetical protein [Metabacillus bambusae]MBO1515583.1 hypothetical protein [Metabacillus bambusae]